MFLCYYMTSSSKYCIKLKIDTIWLVGISICTSMKKKMFNYVTCVINIIKLAIYTHANKVIVEYILEIYV